MQTVIGHIHLITMAEAKASLWKIIKNYHYQMLNSWLYLTKQIHDS
jgi:hypothetical protein